MKVIGTIENDVDFVLHKSFESRLFAPIGNYVNWKLENNWDDYNELYHAVNYINSLSAYDGIWSEIHTIEKDEEIKGVLTIVGGAIDILDSNAELNKNNTILLKYFHIVEKGKGYGSYWLRSVILPYYYDEGFRKIYINSSHPKSFDFYNKIGTEVKTSRKKSDNKIYERICKTFSVPINESKEHA